MSRCFSAVALTFAAFVVGCSSAPPTVPVSGRVTLDKAPLANATVGFEPTAGDKGPAAVNGYAVTDEQGNYTLKLGGNFGDVKGVPAGKYKVTIGKVDRDVKGSHPKQLVPEKYNRDSKLTFDVPAGGMKDANFDLTTK
jgi:hypothetical protein